MFDQVRAERTALSRVMVAALAPLVLLTLLLLFALVSTAAQARRPHVALAKLRGQSRAQVLRFALSEPFLVVAVAVPVGVAIAVGAAHVVGPRVAAPRHPGGARHGHLGRPRAGGRWPPWRRRRRPRWR